METCIPRSDAYNGGMQEETRSDFFSELLKFAALALLIVLPVRLFIAQPFIVSGASMDPTFHNGQYLIIHELSYRLNEPKRGDVVVFRYPKDPTQFFIKRIIGLPNETVAIQDRSVLITKNGEAETLQEPYVKNLGNGSNLTLALGPEEYFVMGDNRPESSDSRIWGALPREDIVGRVILRLLPISLAELRPGSITTFTQ